MCFYQNTFVESRNRFLESKDMCIHGRSHGLYSNIDSSEATRDVPALGRIRDDCERARVDTHSQLTGTGQRIHVQHISVCGQRVQVAAATLGPRQQGQLRAQKVWT